MIERAPFNAADPFDAVAHDLKGKVASLGMRMMLDERFRSLETHRQAECFAAGVMTGMMGVLFSLFVESTEAHDEVERYITDYVKQARQQAEEIAVNGETRQ
jgi:hypothetical protein